MKTCPVCHPELIAPVRKGHTNTAAKSYTSHADCGHPRTAKSREICRRTRRALERCVAIADEVAARNSKKG